MSRPTRELWFNCFTNPLSTIYLKNKLNDNRARWMDFTWLSAEYFPKYFFSVIISYIHFEKECLTWLHWLWVMLLQCWLPLHTSLHLQEQAEISAFVDLKAQKQPSTGKYTFTGYDHNNIQSFFFWTYMPQMPVWNYSIQTQKNVWHNIGNRALIIRQYLSYTEILTLGSVSHLSLRV